MKTTKILGISLVFLLLGGRAAHAYLDAGSGSYVLQVIIASLLGTLVAAKVYWNNIKSFFIARILKKQPPPGDNR